MRDLFASRMECLGSLDLKQMFELADRPGMISFAGGFPSPDLFPLEDMATISEQVVTSMGREALQYGVTQGYPALRRHISHYMKTIGVAAEVEDVFIVSGSQQGLEFSAKLLLNRGDIVFCESPTYIGAINAFRSFECEFVEVAFDKDGMIPEILEELIVKAEKRCQELSLKEGEYRFGVPKVIYVVPDFQNPSGRTWSAERRQAVYDIAVRHNVMIVEDNPYGALRFDGETIAPIKSLDDEGRVIFLGTFSKTLAPGLRIGWAIVSNEIFDKFSALKQAADLQSGVMAQRQISVFLDSCDFKQHVKHLAVIYQQRRDCMIRAIEHYFPSSVRYEVPSGGLFLWVQVRDDIDTRKLLAEAIEENVAFVPGTACFPNGGGERFMRLNYSSMREELLEEGIARLGAILQRYESQGKQKEK